jgi:hypothetical protein
VSVAEDGRGMAAKSLGGLSSKLSRGFPNGITLPGKTRKPRKRRQPGELKHLSNLRKRNHRDSLSSGERNGNSPNSSSLVALGPMLFEGRKTQGTEPGICRRVTKLFSG